MSSTDQPLAILDTAPTAARTTRRLLDTEQVAEILQLSASTLEDWRWQRKGPPFVRISRSCIRYYEDALYAWIDAQTVTEIPKASGL
jgi:predicted DNA-binding transcriptional regulator AlpA